MLMHASRIAAQLTKLAGPLGLIGKGLGAVGRGVWKHPGKALGVGLTAGMTGMAVGQGVKKSRAGLEPDYVKATQYRGVPSIPEV